MKSFARFLPAVTALLLCGCSGFTPSITNGRVVSPSYLAQYCGGGSMSTLWYRGSDQKYHYFAHYVKVSTLYRVPRSELQLPDEFPYKSKDWVFIGASPIWKDL
jgi:hypothetical protein